MEKLIFIDVDGTLVNYEGKVPPGVDETIKKSRKRGNKVLFCTGRSKAEIYPELWEIGFDGMVGGNGSYIEYGNKEVYHKTLSKEQCEEIVNWLYDNGLEFYIESNSGLFASKNFEKVGDPAMKAYTRNDVDGKAMTVRQAFPEMIFGGEVIRDDVNKISFVLNSYDDFKRAVEKFPELQVGTWGGAGEEALFGDIALKGIDKGKAITKLVEYLDFDPTATYAFGDGAVDIPMFEAANTGVAMGNSTLKVKERADFITDDVDQDGLINAFKALGLV